MYNFIVSLSDSIAKILQITLLLPPACFFDSAVEAWFPILRKQSLYAFFPENASACPKKKTIMDYIAPCGSLQALL
jgi:hypothetical protein